MGIKMQMLILLGVFLVFAVVFGVFVWVLQSGVMRHLAIDDLIRYMSPMGLFGCTILGIGIVAFLVRYFQT